MSRKIDKTKYVHDVWESNWYVCPDCNFDSLDISFNHCPSCGNTLDWLDDEEDK